MYVQVQHGEANCGDEYYLALGGKSLGLLLNFQLEENYKCSRNTWVTGKQR